MKNIKISHESPICLLKESRTFNDYEYCLAHLYEGLPEYRDFYKESRKLGRHILLDNSNYELGSAFDEEKFVKIIEDLEPDEYVIPDNMVSGVASIEMARSWLDKYKGLKGRTIGVAHGKTKKDFLDCYKFMKERVDKIAVSFGELFFFERSETLDRLIEKDEVYKLKQSALGRINLFNELKDTGLLSDKPHHLLGCTIASEFKDPIYHECKIESIDTSNPIVCGMSGIEYDNINGSTIKPKEKLCDLVKHEVSDEERERIFKNIKMFRSFVNGGDVEK